MYYDKVIITRNRVLGVGDYTHSFKFKKMGLVETVRQLVEPLLAEKGTELIKVDFLKSKGKYRLILTVDKFAGNIDVEELANINNELGQALDKENLIKERYDLEVSSPGLERPLYNIADYERHKGKKIHVVLAESFQGLNSFSGTIGIVIGDTIEIEMDERNISINFNNIKRANLVYDIREDLK